MANIDNQKEVKKKKTKKYDITIKANKRGRHILPLMNVLRCIIVPFFYIFKPFRFYGNKKIKDGAAVLVCNHYTLLDIVYPGVLTWEGVHFVSKKENGEVPLLGAVMRHVKSIFANRDGNDVRVLLDSLKCLKNGDKIVIFPEGTRNKSGADMLEFHHGAAVMAIKAKAPIIPVVIYKKPRFFRMTHVIVGDHIEFTEYYDRKLSEEEFAEADNKIRDRMLELKHEHSKFLKLKKQKR